VAPAVTRRCSPRHPSCPRSHCELVESYRAARQAELEALEAATALYRAEVVEYLAERPLITFRRWLEGSRAA
jgi:hypothetical protein